MLGRGWFLHAGSLDCLTFQFADKPAAHLPDPATINGHSMIAQHQSKRAHCRHSPRKAPMAAMRKTGRSLHWWLMSQLRTFRTLRRMFRASAKGPQLPFTSRPRCCGTARRRRHSPRRPNSGPFEFTRRQTKSTFGHPLSMLVFAVLGIAVYRIL